MKIWFISDHHFGHTNILNYTNRPYKNVKEMNEDYIKKWNKKISPNDKVYYGGDAFFLNNEKAKEILSQLNGYKILIKGNHDKKKSIMLEIGFDEVYDYLEIEIKGVKVILNHYPFVRRDLNHIAELRPNILNVRDKVPYGDDNKPFSDEDAEKALKDYEFGVDFLKKYYKLPVNRQNAHNKKIFNILKKLASRYIGSRPINKGYILGHGHTHNEDKRFYNAINLSVEAWDGYPVSEDQFYEQIQEFMNESMIKEFSVTKDNYLDISNEINNIKDILFQIKEHRHISFDENELDNRIIYLQNQAYICGTYEEMNHPKYDEDDFYKYLKKIPRNANKDFLEINASNNRYIPMEKLKKNGFYIGRCRNASIAFWDGNKFIYAREKFRDIFLENINCPENDDGYDLFIPHKEYDNSNEEQYNKLEELLRNKGKIK